ncbi:hypothetical protein HUE58_04270 [Candidatus Ruthia endofausta]|uniref:Uncharacterized protein n=1 Tax=Candidatus Ruthia endofausta TaxID=2738852 RepID=A0A6N0HPQ5_9GAMM|nr:hypothetical protein [Candidatus Ruthia endofausta]QKQ24348.1 hypothetical protein HUE58_04270 [Candidatus Ruthia endofausta]
MGFISYFLFPISSFSGFFDTKDEPLKISTIKKSNPVKTQYELAICSVNTKVKKTPAYYHLASVNSKLLCDIDSNTRRETFEAFYNNGWRLIQIVSVDNRLVAKDKTMPYSLIYLERIKSIIK